MIVIPAIDLMDGKAVRLRKGERDQVTLYSDAPWSLVRDMAAAGAERIHIVDLDGAFDGSRKNAATIARIAEEAPVPIQVGGGIRSRDDLAAVFADGAACAVLGTAAIKSPDFVEAACSAHPGQVIVAVDARDGMVAVEGWVESSEISATELGQRAASWGAEGLLYTDIARDGVESGPNVAATAELQKAVAIPVIASGGVSSLADIEELSAAGIQRVVVGRALYEKRFTLQEAIAAADAAA